ncbi:hypothetical protein MBLNU459_g1294t1 [Dothideomycetes sp. NU459]
MPYVKSLLQLLSLAALTIEAKPILLPPPRFGIPISSMSASPIATWDGCLYQVSGVGGFNSRIHYTNWQDVVNNPSSALLKASQATHGNPGHEVTYDESRVSIDTDGSLRMTTLSSHAASAGLTLSAQIETSWTDILHGSARVVAKSSNIPGAVLGFFFYASDTQETDIEIQTSYPQQVSYTNQGAGGPVTTTRAVPDDTSAAYHEYRIDWLPGRTSFYFDGALQATMTRDVSVTPGRWMANCWSNGGPWTLGPPARDVVCNILSVDLYVNRTSVGRCGVQS